MSRDLSNYEVGHRILSQLSNRIIAAMIASRDSTLFETSDLTHPERSFGDVEIPLVERLIILSRMPAFRGSSMQALAKLAQSAVERRYPAGDVITAAGTSSDVVSLLVEGAVELVLPNGRARRSGRQLVAHLDELATGQRSITATAATDAIVLQLEREDLIDRIEEHFDLCMTLLAFVAGEQDRVNNASSSGACRVA